MEHDELDRLIRRIIETEDEEIDCGQVAELVARYVDLEVAGEAASQLLPKVRQHIGQCDTCAELYETLLELALLEDRNALPDADRLLDEIVAGGADDGSTVRPVTGAPPLTVLPHVGAPRAGGRSDPGHRRRYADPRGGPGLGSAACPVGLVGDCRSTDCGYHPGSLGTVPGIRSGPSPP
jgi:hypothetical protein